MTNGLDREYIARRIGEVEYWHQRIPITEDIMTPGAQDTQTMLAYVGLPEDCSGMRVLDIGTRDGFFAFEVERRGASEVIGLDNVPPHLTGFNVAKELLNSRAEYVVDNVYNLSVAKYGRFDLVLFFGVLYHLRHPLLAMDRIWDVCNQSALLYVESHMIDEGLVDGDGALHRLDALNPHLLGFPLVEFLPGAMLAGDFTSKWAPNQVALRGMLESAGFDVSSEWLLGSRGGATAVARFLDPQGQRAVDAASEWDLVRGHVISGSEFSPPVESD